MEFLGTATYSPEDNKLRLYPFARLSKDDYDRVKAAGFKWAPKQELFVAPMWTPGREDLLTELCGEVGDEDTSLVDRAEQRAERFEEYSDKRAEDAERVRVAVDAICEHIPLGQPILIGHHSERHARKDAERIQSGMRRAVQMWKTSEYWTARASSALSHAKYKELPAVRYRRIKTIEADMRKQLRELEEVRRQLAAWEKVSAVEDPEQQKQRAVTLADSRTWVKMPRKDGDQPDFDQSPDVYTCLTGSYPTLYAPRTVAEVLERVVTVLTHSARPGNSNERWIEHYTNRIAYERAMLDEHGGLKGEQIDYQIGGRILRRGEWLPILKVNKRNGVVQSVTVSGHFASTVSIDEIRDYRPPQDGEAEKVKAAMDKGPMCNYPGEGFKHMTTAEWKRFKMSDVPQAIIHKATETHGKHRTRATAAPQWSTVAVYLTDSKRVDPPPAPTVPEEPVRFERIRELQPARTPEQPCEQAQAFDALEQTLKAGVQVVTAPQLFPTPPALAARMVEVAGIESGHRVLEPSAGTGNILAALPTVRPNGAVTAVEISSSLIYKSEPYADHIVCGDFLEQNGNLGTFDRVVMNPPFANGADIKHIQHALHMLKPGGRLVALCANGSRQRDTLKPLAENSGGWWEDLPAGTFAEQGTNVNTALLVIEAAPANDPEAELRTIWNAAGLSKEKQDAIIADAHAKAQPGASVGPFTLQATLF